MNNEEIYDLISRFENSNVHKLKLTRDDFSLELSKTPPAPVAGASFASPLPTQSAAPAAQEPEKESGLYIKAPLVGTFYLAASPDSPPFVKLGQTIKSGETVCLMEAMKMMSEVPAPCDCVIEQCMQEDGTLVAYDAPLFRYRPV